MTKTKNQPKRVKSQPVPASQLDKVSGGGIGPGDAHWG
jgi:hypothetical protein